jgi:hypothetical protein
LLNGNVKHAYLTSTMKKSIVLFVLICLIGSVSFAQHKEVEKKDKVRKTSNLGQKVHNIFHKHKHYNGYKVKHVTKVEKAS